MHCCQFVGVVLLLLCQILLSHEDSEDHKCPIGFQLSYTKSRRRPICHRLKGPEDFEDVYEDCVGNMFSVKLYHDLNITAPKQIWTEYRSFYPGGLFIDTSHTDGFGDELEMTDLTINRDINLDEEWCSVLDPHTNFTIVKCSEKHYRYCFVKPYRDADDMSTKGCKDFDGSFRFRSPISTCLLPLEGVGGSSLRATWSQARGLCSKRASSLLYRGWRYINSPKLEGKILPLGVKYSADSLRYDALNDRSVVPRSKWNFAEENESRFNKSFGAQCESAWYLVNSTYVFLDVVCERAVPLRNLRISVIYERDKDLMKVTVNDTIDRNDIVCYTDSVTRYPVKVTEDSPYTYRLHENGYYWCSHKDVMNFEPTESNRILYIKKPESKYAKNVFAIKIELNESYNLKNLTDILKKIKPDIKKYLYYKFQYESLYGTLNGKSAETNLTDFMEKNPDSYKVVKNVGFVLKRVYLDFRTALVHATLDPNHLGRVSPGTWQGMRILSVKSVYYCTGLLLPDTPLGGSVNVSECRTYHCVGEFTEGVDWLLKSTEGCGAPLTTTPRAHPTTVRAGSQTANETNTWSGESSEESTELTPNVTVPLTTEEKPTPEPTVVTTAVPTTATITPPRPPRPTTMPSPTVAPPVTTDLPTTTAIPRDVQLQQVMDDLYQLVNKSDVSVGDIDNVFDQVDDILMEHDDELEIPGQLLHLLDQLGSTVVLNETRLGRAVRPNIALLMADAQPDNPVRGFRISIVNDTFQDQDFEFISEEPNATILSAGESEVVVNLPSSVSEAQRRVSFVVFRNNRAFHSHGYTVNSRVLSVNIENVAHFHGGEVIDIHLSPRVTALARNESRSCAYWHFLENDTNTGYWSQEGCTFIRATEDGMLDTCRCNHLTHFAEVIVPKAVFSEADESALETISVIGCILSILGLILIGVTALIFRSWRREYSNKIWLQLCIAIFVLVLSFLLVIFVNFDQYDTACLLVGMLLHYAVLASFCWMLVAAVLAYRRLVLVFSRDASHKLLKAAAFSWGTPCLVVGVLLSVSRHSYARRFEEMTPSGAFCYPTGLGFWLTVYAPISAILLTNWILFALIVRSVFVSRRIQRHGESNEALRCASVSCMLVFLFGLPWVFGLFASNVVGAYLFTLTATFQGFILFVFFVIGNKKTRDLWLDKLHIKQTRKMPVTSSTYTNRSVEWRAANAPVTLEAKISKPKVLASKDETRFF